MLLTLDWMGPRAIGGLGVPEQELYSESQHVFVSNASILASFNYLSVSRLFNRVWDLGRSRRNVQF